MVAPNEFLIYIVINLTVWPALSLAYWYLVQRQEEELIESMSQQQAGQQAQQVEG